MLKQFNYLTANVIVSCYFVKVVVLDTVQSSVKNQIEVKKKTFTTANKKYTWNIEEQEKSNQSFYNKTECVSI